MTSKVGISQIGIAIPKHFISIKELAEKRKIPSAYAGEGLGVVEARVPYQTSITELAAEALMKISFRDVERFYIGTESDPDASKPLGVKILNHKLGLSSVPFQYKFACLGGLQALISACEYSQANSGKPAVALSIDRSIYSQEDPKAEVTQGCAAVAMRIEARPKILALDYQNLGQYGADIDDFKVPSSSYPFPQVNGALTKPAFLECQKKALENWKKKNLKSLKTEKKGLLEMFDFFIMHTPFPKIVEWVAALFWRHEKLKQKEHLTLAECLKKPGLFLGYKKELDGVRETPEFKKFFRQKFSPGLKYNPYIGNSYTSSIFICLAGVLEKAEKGQQIGINGYGGGASSICIKGTVVSNKKFRSDLGSQLKKGKKLTIKQYLKWRESQ
ncbi:MAG TPA: hydroxymethylglutaryl-CoA synthase [Candidatus Humimicrobiaceae bacterium]|nr:hydroxymethylglutaryl-CoA synthase [Candidatus Humimicrobiaceae bacterium]